jgi:hypothetical protein
MIKPTQYEPPLKPAGRAPITDVPGMDFSGPTRLEELEEQYPYSDGFEESVIKAARSGEIGLLPIGNSVHVRHTSD